MPPRLASAWSSKSATVLSRVQSRAQCSRAKKRVTAARWRVCERRASAAAVADMRPGWWQKAVISRTRSPTVVAERLAGRRNALTWGRVAAKITGDSFLREQSDRCGYPSLYRPIGPTRRSPLLSTGEHGTKGQRNFKARKRGTAAEPSLARWACARLPEVHAKPPAYRLVVATRQCWSERSESCGDFMKFGLSSSGCESRPTKAEPGRSVASLAVVRGNASVDA